MNRRLRNVSKSVPMKRMKAVAMILALGEVFWPLLAAASEKPNIVFMLMDDMGYADIGCYGAPDVKTPQIDRLASEGVRLTQCYAMGAECTPSRTAILTGRYPQRAGGMECAIGTGNVGRYDDAEKLAGTGDLGLPAAMAVLAPGLKESGYETAIFGKWHMGYEEKFNPLNQGFDEFFGFLGGNVDYFTHEELSDLPVLYEGRVATVAEGYMTHLIAERAVEYLGRKTFAERPPLFLYLPFSVPHFPFQGPDDEKAGVLPDDQWTVGTREKFVEMLEEMDAGVGRVLKALEENGMVENTLVVYASDHGAMAPGLNTPFRDYKGTLFEGGIRVPCIARWPKKIGAGGESAQMCSLMDWTASFLRVGGAGIPGGGELDGIDILKHLENGTGKFERTFFWRDRRGERTWWAVRHGDAKYVRRTEGAVTEEWLFDLGTDAAETEDLFSENEEIATELKKMLAGWELGVKAER